MQTFGIYSFPRSGSNWLRTVTYALLAKPYLADPESVQEEEGNPIHRAIPDHPENDPESGIEFDTTRGKFKFYKTHAEAVVHFYNGRRFDTSCYSYIARHPLDVFLSYVNYLSYRRDLYQWAYALPLRSVKEHIANDTLSDVFSTFITIGNISPGLDLAGSWFSGVERWIGLKKEYRDFIFLFSYEKLVMDPVRTFGSLGEFVGNGCDVASAIKWTEDRSGPTPDFFWMKSHGYHKKLLPPELIERFNRIHGSRVQDLLAEVDELSC